MSTEADFTQYGIHYLASGASAWIPIVDREFDVDHWQGLSVFPRPFRQAAPGEVVLPLKITIVEQDWEIDESNTPVCWVLVSNISPVQVVAGVDFMISAIKLPNR